MLLGTEAYRMNCEGSEGLSSPKRRNDVGFQAPAPLQALGRASTQAEVL